MPRRRLAPKNGRNDAAPSAERDLDDEAVSDGVGWQPTWINAMDYVGVFFTCMQRYAGEEERDGNATLERPRQARHKHTWQLELRTPEKPTKR